MTNDNSITRLLYAILSQKCLKDIDWNRVAQDPVLSQEISNGHAARMRYSRFKKQMDGTSAARRPRNTASVSPRKNKVEKNRNPKKIKDRRPSEEHDRIKMEAGEEVGSSQETAEAAPKAAVVGLGLGLSMDHVDHSPVVKREPGMRSSDSIRGSQYPLTPGDSHAQSETPSPGFGGTGDLSDLDGMMISSFTMPGQGMYHHPGSMIEPNHHDYSMEMNMGMETQYSDMWHLQTATDGEGALVKAEPSWDGAYRHGQA